MRERERETGKVAASSIGLLYHILPSFYHIKIKLLVIMFVVKKKKNGD